MHAKFWMVLLLATITLAPVTRSKADQSSEKSAANTPIKTDEQIIRDLDTEWSHAVENKDAAKCASFYSETGSALPFNAPIALGRASIQELWTNLMAKPGFSLHFSPTHIEVAHAKDLAYDVGTFELKMNDAQGTPMIIPGKYVVVWKKQNAGNWQAELDIFNPDK